MLSLFLLAGFVSVGLIAVVIASILAGIILAALGKTRFLAPLTLVPILSCGAALLGSWALSSAAHSASSNASSLETMERMEILAIWGWPIGLVVGGTLGLGLGVLAAALLLRRLSPTPERRT